MSNKIYNNLDLNTNYPTSNKLLNKINKHKLKMFAHNHVRNAFKNIN